MNTRIKVILVLVTALVLTTVIMLPRISKAYGNRDTADPATGLSGQNSSPADVQVVASYHNDTSKPLRDLPARPAFSKQQHENENPKIPNKHRDSADPVVQNSFSDLKSIMTPNISSPVLNFNGIGFPGVACNCAPPDTNGEVGATQ